MNDNGLHSHTVQEVGKEYATRRKQFRKSRLAWRKSRGVRRSLGWVPFKSGAAKWKNGQVFFNGQHFKVWDSFGLSPYKFSRRLVDQHGEIVVGDVSSTKLAKTRMAKSVLDAGWGQLKTMLEYKCDHAGIVFREVREAYTTRTCSSCGSLSGPRGVNGLRIRDWECVACGVLHDRDVNAARNILSLGAGRCPPAVGISSLREGRTSNHIPCTLKIDNRKEQTSCR